MSAEAVGQRETWADALRYPLMLGVLLIHAYEPFTSFGGALVSLRGRSEIADVVMYAVSQGLARLAVPIFFLLAGLFLARAKNIETLVIWLSELKKRSRTLLLPYVLWSLIVYAAYFAWQCYKVAPIGAASHVPQLSTLGLVESFKLTLGLNGPPIAYQFWFIRDLLICMFFSYPLFKVPEGAHRSFVAILGAIWFSGLGESSIPASAAVFFFSFGLLLGRTSTQPGFELSGSKFLFAMSVLLFGAVYFRGSDSWAWWQRGFILVGVFGVKYIGQFFTSGGAVRNWLKSMGGTAFFLFCIHEPMLMLFKKYAYGLIDPVGFSSVLACFTLPVALVALCSHLIFVSLSKFAPQLLALLTGGRR